METPHRREPSRGEICALTGQDDVPVLVLDDASAVQGSRAIVFNDGDPKQLPRGSFYKPIRRAALRASQFPSQVPDAKGIVHKPPDWWP